MTKPGTNRGWWIAVALSGGLGVSLGAYGAHGLEDLLASSGMDPEKIAKRISQFESGARNQVVHTVALLALAAAKPIEGVFRVAAILFMLGILFFSGSLYVLVLTDTTWLGAVTPIGGLSWIVGWASLAFAKTSNTDPEPAAGMMERVRD